MWCRAAKAVKTRKIITPERERRIPYDQMFFPHLKVEHDLETHSPMYTLSLLHYNEIPINISPSSPRVSGFSVFVIFNMPVALVTCSFPDYRRTPSSQDQLESNKPEIGPSEQTQLSEGSGKMDVCFPAKVLGRG